MSEAPVRTDAQLVAAFREGDVHAFEELHRRYVGSIYRLVHRKLGDGLLAEDIAQETFLKALRTMDRVDESFNFGGWIHTVARNLCFDELRRRQRDLRAEGEVEDEEDVLVRLPAPSGPFDPAQASETAELRRQVYQVAQLLPEKYRLVLTLRELQGFSYRRIARAMRISESAVETLLYRARLRFKEEFVALQGGHGLACSEVQPLLAPYVAGKLRRSQAEAVRDHLAHCVRCSRHLGRKPPARAGKAARER
ncbi:MAG TPA: sigma-70 family RNA polymerase sigma factor [Candidatus Acidoferrales bacterium]|nr:sigma-70 family RNA polymerase sigma factor [Candidatus Acidoferrales bacterium]